MSEREDISTENKLVYPEERSWDERLVAEWRAYRDQFLTPIPWEEARRLYEVANKEAAASIDPPEYTVEELESVLGKGGNHDAFQRRVLETWMAYNSRLIASVIDRLWEAGYLITYDRETYSYQPYLNFENLVWKVAPQAPEVPESAYTKRRDNPTPGLKLGSRPLAPAVAEGSWPLHLRPMMTASAYSLIERASRDGRNWIYDPAVEVLPFFEDSNKLRLTYGTIDNNLLDLQIAAEIALEQLNKLDDRTADVWGVILWKALEEGPSGENVYARIRIDTREVARLLGYKPHHKGGMKPEHLLEVQEALQHLERMRLYVPPGTKGTLERDTGQEKGKRKKQPLQRAREERVIAVMAREVERNLFGHEYHMIWELALGEWARYFPRSYAPYFKILLEKPNKGVHRWAKRIGNELMLLYRQDVQRGSVKRIKWGTLLERAQLSREVEERRAARNTSRVQRYAEEALQQLQDDGVVKSWRIAPQHEERTLIGMGKPGNFDTWLDAVVEIEAPEDVMNILTTITPPKKSTKGRKKSPPSN